MVDLDLTIAAGIVGGVILVAVILFFVTRGGSEEDKEKTKGKKSKKIPEKEKKPKPKNSSKKTQRPQVEISSSSDVDADNEEDNDEAVLEFLKGKDPSYISKEKLKELKALEKKKTQEKKKQTKDLEITPAAVEANTEFVTIERAKPKKDPTKKKEPQEEESKSKKLEKENKKPKSFLKSAEELFPEAFPKKEEEKSDDKKKEKGGKKDKSDETATSDDKPDEEEVKVEVKPKPKRTGIPRFPAVETPLSVEFEAIDEITLIDSITKHGGAVSKTTSEAVDLKEEL